MHRKKSYLGRWVAVKGKPKLGLAILRRLFDDQANVQKQLPVAPLRQVFATLGATHAHTIKPFLNGSRPIRSTTNAFINRLDCSPQVTESHGAITYSEDNNNA